MKLINFLICDDIRNEIGNKHSLIGVYDDSIEFSVLQEKKNIWPKSLKIGIFSRILFTNSELKKGIHSFNLSVKYNDELIELGSGILSDNIIKQLNESNKLTIAMVNNNFVFKEEGQLNFLIKFFNNKKENIGTLNPDLSFKVTERVLQ